MSPPLNKETLAPKIAELTIKLKGYNENGEAILKEEETKLMQGQIEEEVPEESKEHYHHHYDDGQREGDYRGGRGGRGGSRGGRGGREDHRGGARGGRGGRGGARDNGDRRRDDGDDDIYVSSGDE